MGIDDKIRKVEKEIEYYEDLLHTSKDPSFIEEIKYRINLLKIKLLKLIRKTKLDKTFKKNE